MSAVQHTPGQLAVLRHALGLKPNGSGHPYRNHFVTGPGSTDYDLCESLVAAGAMTRREGNPLSGGDPVYSATAQGRFAAVQRGGA